MNKQIEKPNVLVVDDDETLRQMLGEFLVSEGFEVIAAADGKEALEITLCHPRSWHAIITDFQMPKDRRSGVDSLNH